MTEHEHHRLGFSRFVGELSRRHVVRFSLGYAAAAFVIVQFAQIVLPAFGIGDNGLRVVVIVVGLLFPPAVVLAWLFDITPEGIRRTADPDAIADGLPAGSSTPRLVFLGFTVLVVGGVGLWLAKDGAFTFSPASPSDSSGVVSPVLAKYEPGQPIRSLAVLPFENISPGGGQDYFSEGMQEELTAQLSQLSGLRVVSRTSVMRYLGSDLPIPTIGKELQVDAVIEGSVRRDSTHVRITVQLIQAASDTHIWTRQYDRDLKDVLALESEVAQEIAGEVRARITPEEHALLTRTASSNMDFRAQESYLRGRYDYQQGTPEAYRSAMRHFQEAVSRDSTFAPALTGLAGSRFLLSLSDPSAPGADPVLAEREADRALTLDSLSNEAREVAAIIRRNMPGPGAARPNDTTWIAAMTQLGRRIEEQLRSSTRDTAREGRIQQVLAARQLMVSGNFGEATDLLRGIVETNPTFGIGWELLARAQLAAGQVDSTVATLDRWRAAGGQGAPTADEIKTLRAAVKKNGAKGYWTWALARMEQREASGHHVSRGELAAAYAALGRTDDAFKVLQEGVHQGDRSLLTLQTDPVWDPLRSDPRFADIVSEVRKMRLAPGHRSPAPAPPPGREGTLR
jgi:adenylate cyclase